MDRYQDAVEEQIREAMERGEFDDLPGRGRRLELRDDDPAWWARRKIQEMRRQDQVVELIAEVEREIERMWSLPDEAAVRVRVAAINSRIELLNEELTGEETLATLDPRAAVHSWRRMTRLRPGTGQ